MTSNAYSHFLPEPWRSVAQSIEPESTWWRWDRAPERQLEDVDVHIARACRPEAPVRVMLIHGAGGHSGLVWPLASILASEDCEVLAPDLPLYGQTDVRYPGRVRYRDWVDVLHDLVVDETDRDPRPLVLFGASMGGMLAYEVAHRTGRAAAVVATCLLDFAGDPEVARHAVRYGWMARLAPLLGPLMPFVGRMRLPIKTFAPIDRMSKNPELSRLCADDPLGAGSALPLQLIVDLLDHEPPPPERYAGPPVILLHPGDDDWTPAELSMRFVGRIAGPVDTVLLTGCGHFPIEQPGLDEAEQRIRQLRDALVDPTT